MTRRTFGPAAALAAAVLGYAGAANALECKGTPTGVSAVVNVSNLRSDQGPLAVTIYREKGFLKKGGSVKVWRDPAHAGSQSMCVWLPGPGLYAIGVFQDLDSDHKLDYNLLSGPTEPWGFSNNPRAIWPLRFSQVRFDAKDGETVLNVRLH
jgi:uncharacterized protein (DUF2141 family)